MLKFAAITDFFKPSPQSRSNKRPSPDADVEEQPRQKRRSLPDNEFEELKVRPSHSAIVRSHEKHKPTKDIGVSTRKPAHAVHVESNANGYSNNSSALSWTSRREHRDAIAVGTTGPVGEQKAELLESAPKTSQDDDTAVCGRNLSRSNSMPHGSDPTIQPDNSSLQSKEDTAVARIELTANEKSRPLESITRSSQRIVKNGAIVIRSSDDESDSDSSLDDIDGLIARKSAPNSTPPTESELTPPLANTQIGQKIRASSRLKKPNTAVSSTPQVQPKFRMPPEYKFSLASLVQRSKEEKALGENIAKAKSALDSHGIENSLTFGGSHGSAPTEAKIDRTLLVSLMKKKNEGEDIDRLLMAVQRTEAFDLGTTWSFFDDVQGILPSKQAKFPTLTGTRWEGILNDAISKEQSFLQGHVGDIASKGGLPEGLLCWILDAVCVEPKDDLRNSYIYTLQEARDQLRPILTPSFINVMFQKIGGSADAVDIQKPITPVTAGVPDKLDRKHDINQSKLLPVLNLVKCISSGLSADSRIHMICMLSRLLLDASVVKSFEINELVKTSFSSLFDCLPKEGQNQELQAISTKIYSFVEDSTLRLQMLQNIPSTPPQLSILRRRLALAFFFENEDYLCKTSKDLIDMKAIARQLRKPRFKIRNDTDYTELAALVATLNIGFDNGNPPLPGSDKQKSDHFNRQIDSLSDCIHAMFSHIVDTGASHMKRTQAKQVLELFHSKLLYDIRTKPKPKTMMFESSKTDGDQESLNKFLLRSPEKGSQGKDLRI